MSEAEITTYRQGNVGIVSVTVYAEKPEQVSQQGSDSINGFDQCISTGLHTRQRLLLTDNPMIYRPATATDRPALVDLLTQVDLLIDDLPSDLSTFTLAFDVDQLVGAAGVEVLESAGLLRSVAVSPERQHQQIGRQLIDASLHLAREKGVTDLYLITTTADGYFERLGFGRVNRTGVPAAIAQTRQFSDLCPASSVVMSKKM